MNEIYTLGLASLQHDMARVDAVATNLANVSTPGYKRQVVATRAFADQVEDAQAAAVLTDTRAGTVKTTGQALDLVLAGDGWFEVLTDRGPAYTRRGNFSVDARGRIVTAQGHPVMGKSGEIQLTGRAPVIDAAGNVTEAGAAGEAVPVGQLKVLRFDPGQPLQRLGDGLVAPAEGMTPVEDHEVQLRQGALENANVNTTHEMVDLIQTMRHFESVHRVLQGYDEMVGGAVRKLSESI